MTRGAAVCLVVLASVAACTAADLKEELWAAAKRGDARAIEDLLARGADVNAPTAYGATPLYFAATKGHLEAVRVLIKHKADVNAKDSFYQTSILAWAAQGGHAAVVRELLAAGAKGAGSILLSAAQSNDVALARAVLDKGKHSAAELTAALAAAQKAEVRDLLTRAGAKPAPPVPRLDAAVLRPYTGTFDDASGNRFELAAKDGQLVLQSSGRDQYQLTKKGADAFQLVGTETILTFKREGSLVTGFTYKVQTREFVYRRVDPSKATTPKPPPAAPKDDDASAVVQSPLNWPSFRGPQASGVADGQHPPTAWDVPKGRNVRWKTPIPGLGHACPVVWGDRVFVTTAVGSDPDPKLRTGLYGDVTPINEPTVHTWHVYAIDKRTGRVLWDRIAHRGVPRVKRHPKGSHANCTPATDGKHLVVCLGSEGLFCYDLDGNLKWKRDLGVLDSGFFFDADYQWGFGSSPIIYQDTAILQCDLGKGSFIAAYRLADGKEAWRTPREEIPSWGTPTVVAGPAGPELVTSATKFARGYDPATGKERWRLGRHAEITVPTPVAGHGLVFITSGYRPIQPIYAVRPGARGDITLKEGTDKSSSVAWSHNRGGPYMTTPIVYGDYLYVCSNYGILACYEARTGKRVYQERLGGSSGYTASPVAADGRLYFPGEEGAVRVVRAGPKFELLAVNPAGDPIMATPAISDGMTFLRTQHSLIAVGRPERPAQRAAR